MWRLASQIFVVIIHKALNFYFTALLLFEVSGRLFLSVRPLLFRMSKRNSKVNADGQVIGNSDVFNQIFEMNKVLLNRLQVFTKRLGIISNHISSLHDRRITLEARNVDVIQSSHKHENADGFLLSLSEVQTLIIKAITKKK